MPDARQLQQLWRLNGPGRKQHLPTCVRDFGDFVHAALSIAHPHGTSVAHHHAGGLRTGFDAQIAAMSGRL